MVVDPVTSWPLQLNSMTQNQEKKNYKQLEHDLKLYISQILKWVGILDYMKWDFGD